MTVTAWLLLGLLVLAAGLVVFALVEEWLSR